MTLETERAAIEGRFQTLWVDGGPARTPVGYSGHNFEPVKGSNSARITIRSGGSETTSIGSPGANNVRHSGVIMIEIYTPNGQGEATVRGLAEEAMTIFRNQVFGGVRCRDPYVSGVREEHSFLVWTIVVPFERDELNG